MSSSFPAMAPLVFAVGMGVRYVSRKGSGTGGAGRAKRGPKPVDIDRAYGDAELAELRAAAVRADWPAMAGILEPIRRREDHERLAWLIGAVDDVKAERLRKLAAQHPDDALVRSVVGARTVAFAWEARTSSRASQVSEEQFKLFHQRLREAEDHLYTAVELDPESAAPWHSLVIASRGLEHGHDITRRRFEAGTARSPHHFGLHRQMLQQLCRKWGGSHEEMHAFARESTSAAPGGSAIGALVADAHVEHWLDLPRQEDAAYLLQPHVLRELREAAARSIDHPDFAPTTTPYAALNSFAMAFWMAGDKSSAARCFRRIGDHATQSPWQYAGNPGEVFAFARAECKKSKQTKQTK